MIKKRYNTDNLFNPNLPKVYQTFYRADGTPFAKTYWMMQIPLEAGTYAIDAIATGKDYYYLIITDKDLKEISRPTQYFITPINISKTTFTIGEGEYLWIWNANGGTASKLDALGEHNIMLNKGTTYKEYVPYIQEVKKVIKNGTEVVKIYKGNNLIFNKEI